MECRPEADRHRACCPALTAMGKDITDVDGTDLVSMICNSEKLSDGSNELIYALMALDAANAAIPADAKWSRNTIIEAMLGFQNENRWVRTDRKRQHQCRYDGHGTSGPCTLSGANRSKRSD